MSVKRFYVAFRDDEAGAVAIEYALIAVIVSIAIVAGLTNTKQTLNSELTNVSTQLNNNTSN